MAILRPIVAPTRTRRLPSAIYFEGDALARTAVVQCARIRHASFEAAEAAMLEGDHVFVLADERLLAAHLKYLRSPNIRVVVLSDRRFQDARLDGTVYAYLPLNTPPVLLERMFDNAFEHIHLVLTRREASEKLALANSEIQSLNQIGAALSAEHDTKKLLHLILEKCREITRADAGSIYLKEELESEQAEGRSTVVLRFMLAQNDSIAVPFEEVVLPVDESSIAGYVADCGKVVMVEDAYALESWAPYTINKQFDCAFGYRTKSIIAVPMRNPKGKIVGVVELINAKRNARSRLGSPEDVEQQVLPFSTRQMEIVCSLASQAAVAYENSQHYENVERLFEGFVKASVAAIEQRDPTTSGHAFRVTNLTIALAEAVHRDECGFAGIEFTPAEMKEIRYASLLHDFGKLGVREQLLTKARKLYPEQCSLIAARFEVARQSLRADCAARKLQCLAANGEKATAETFTQIERELEDQLRDLDRFEQIIDASNRPSIQPEGTFETLHVIAGTSYRAGDGSLQPLLTGDEVRLLSMRKGSLDEAERAAVEAHVVHTYNLLKQIPWPPELRNIPEIARHHHEKPNGTGYPANLQEEEISLAGRMMAIADVFDALTAHDRPYKPAVSVERALEILGQMARGGELDSQLFALFVRDRVYELHKVECREY